VERDVPRPLGRGGAAAAGAARRRPDAARPRALWARGRRGGALPGGERGHAQGGLREGVHSGAESGEGAGGRHAPGPQGRHRERVRAALPEGDQRRHREGPPRALLRGRRQHPSPHPLRSRPPSPPLSTQDASLPRAARGYLWSEASLMMLQPTLYGGGNPRPVFHPSREGRKGRAARRREPSLDVQSRRPVGVATQQKTTNNI
ncbi:unnamed protein product, partial [Prorocentrum cordatum]